MRLKPQIDLICLFLQHKYNLYVDICSFRQDFVCDIKTQQTQPEVLFTWHLGETLMQPLTFNKRTIKLQNRYTRGSRIDNSIQSKMQRLKLYPLL